MGYSFGAAEVLTDHLFELLVHRGLNVESPIKICLFPHLVDLPKLENSLSSYTSQPVVADDL